MATKLHASESDLLGRIAAGLKKKKLSSTTADDLIATLKPLIGFELDPKPVKNARSFLGGLPLAPEDFEWPEGDDGPYAFLGQIAFEDVKPHDVHGKLPAKGIVYFFAAYDEDSVANEEVLPGAVKYIADADELVEAEKPEFGDEVEAMFKKRTLRFHPAVMADLNLLTDADDDKAFIQVLKANDADWDGFVGGKTLLFPKFELDDAKQTILVHFNARNFQRLEKGDTSSMYAASCFDIVVEDKALKKAELDEAEIWFDFFH